MEVWKKIPETDYYYVSNYGNVKSVNRKITDSIGRTRTIKGKFHSTKTISNAGYNQFSIRIKNKVKTFDLHRIVALLFLKKEPHQNSVNHIDGNKRNNTVLNLEWCTPSENNTHALDNGLKSYGGLCSYSKLTNKEFKEIFELATEGVFSQKQIASLYGISKGNVSKIKTGKVASRITGKIYKPVGRGKGRVK